MGKEPVFDMAYFESSLPGQPRVYTKTKKGGYYSMLSAYSGDGGHLNSRGKQRTAQQLLIMLANLHQ